MRIAVSVAGTRHALIRVARLAGKLDRPRRRALLRAGLAAQALGLAFLFNPRESLEEWWSGTATTFLRAENERSYSMARYIKRRSEKDLLVAVFWAGALPYYCDRPMLDVLGRTDPHIARVPAPPDQGYWPGHAKRDWDYVLGLRKPDILMAAPPEVARRRDYVEEYCHPPGAHWLALRRDALRKWHSRYFLPRCIPVSDP